MPRTRSNFSLWVSLIFAMALGALWGWLMASAPMPRRVNSNYRPRIGHSKVSGTFSGTFLAGAKILGTIARHALSRAG